MEYQSNLNQFGYDSFNTQYDNNSYYNNPSYNSYTTPSYTQTTLNQFDSNLGTPSYNSYSTPSYNSYTTPSYTQTTLNQFDNSYDVNSSSGLYNSNRNYGQFSTGGNLHDTFRVDRYDNLYGGHTTVDLGNNQKTHLDW